MTSSASKNIAFRKNGDTDEAFTINTNTSWGIRSTDVPVGFFPVCAVFTDASGVIEMKSESGTATFVIDVIGYIPGA